MNAPIARLYGLVIVMFALLVAFTSRWTVFDATSLRDNPLNRRSLLEEQLVPRGLILAADGSVLARSYKGPGGVYQRTYPQNGLFAHAVGYSYTNIGRAALERSRNNYLVGPASGIGSILDQLSGKTRVGDNVYTTLDPTAQRVALAQLAGRKGAVVALDPRNGAIKVFASVPGYNPSGLDADHRFQKLSTDAANSPLFDRVTQSGYPPGSTFKVVTDIAALDSGRFTPQSVVNGNSPISISGVPLSNDGNASYGPVDLTTALTNSVNTVWAQVAEQVGRSTMARYMNRLGFDQAPPLDLPSSELLPSGEYRNGRLLDPRSQFVDVGRMGIGQDKLNVTPLQMAQVAAAVANNGRLMQPHLTDRVVDRDGRTVLKVGPTLQSVAMKPSTAAAVTQMMAQVVREGTGTAAALQGIQVAGKTGTAQITPTSPINQVWFIAFAPVNHPRIAIAVTIERAQGFGGVVAAPIAKTVMQTLLQGH